MLPALVQHIASAPQISLASSLRQISLGLHILDAVYCNPLIDAPAYARERSELGGEIGHTRTCSRSEEECR